MSTPWVMDHSALLNSQLMTSEILTRSIALVKKSKMKTTIFSLDMFRIIDYILTEDHLNDLYG